MDIKCPNCLNIFQPNTKQEKLIVDAIKKKQRLVMLECPKCYKSVPINPCDLLMNTPRIDRQEIIKCPICHEGVVSYINNGSEHFWGCGECGNIWHTKKELDNTISKK